jgi:8-oxo-dGTP pyrophosphatase MutT (NUDIX family)
MTGERIDRAAARAVLLAPTGEILLMHAREPWRGKLLWIAPGGGLLPAEDPVDCVKREVREETGLRDCEVGPRVWEREHTFRWNSRWVRQREAYYLVRTPIFEPTIDLNPDEAETASFLEFGWWSAGAMERSSDLFVPRSLSRHLGTLVRSGPPDRPIDVGV